VGAREEAHLIEVLRQGGNRVWVVRHVQHQRRLAGQDLEPARQLHEGQACTDRLCADRQPLMQYLEHCQNARRIEQLIDAAQRWIRQPRKTLLAPRPLPLLAIAAVGEIAAR
jgi:hypothetical protein